MNPRIAYLIQQSVANEISDEEQKELSHIVNKDKELFNIYQFLIAKNNGHTEEDLLNAEQAYAAHFVKMETNKQFDTTAPTHKQLAQTPVSILRKQVLYYVAAACLIAVAFTTIYLIPSKNAINQPTASTGLANNIITTNKGSKSHLTLPDGTKVWLNADSKLTYGAFGGKTREVTLSGEAFFDVAKDVVNPFIIHTGKMDIRVVGTSFNVRNYPHDETIETSLIHGKIELTFSDKPNEKFILRPNEKLTIRKNEETQLAGVQQAPKIQVNNIFSTQDSTVLETAWMDNKLAFSNETLENIARELERQFDETIEFADDEVKFNTYTGIFEKEDCKKILHLLSISRKFEFDIANDKIVIRK